ncbi:hypothetical protein Tco_0833921 [Tanacetum coccineum]
MTRSSTKDLFTPYEEPKRVLHSTRKLFKTTSLDYSSSLEFDLFSNIKDQCKEEVTEAIGEPTMEEYMTKTREDYRLGIARPKIDEKAHFELKEIIDLFHIPDVTQDQIMLQVFPMSLTGAASRWLRNEPEVSLFYKGLDVPTRQILDSKGAIPSIKAAYAKKAIQDMTDHSQKWHNKLNERVYAAQVRCELCNGPHYTKDCPLKEEGKTLEEAHYTQFGVPFPQGGRYRAAAPGLYQRDNGNPLYQERRQTIEESLSKFMAEFVKRHDENSNLIKKIRASTDAAIRNQGASIKALEFKSGK